MKEKYPKLFLQDLSFNGETYKLYFKEEEKEYAYEYEYLKRFEEMPENGTAIYSKSIRYLLVNDSEVTWDEIWHGMISSQSGDYIDYKTVYVKYIYENK